MNELKFFVNEGNNLGGGVVVCKALGICGYTKATTRSFKTCQLSNSCLFKFKWDTTGLIRYRDDGPYHGRRKGGRELLHPEIFLEHFFTNPQDYVMVNNNGKESEKYLDQHEFNDVKGIYDNPFGIYKKKDHAQRIESPPPCLDYENDWDDFCNYSRRMKEEDTQKRLGQKKPNQNTVTTTTTTTTAATSSSSSAFADVDVDINDNPNPRNNDQTEKTINIDVDEDADAIGIPTRQTADLKRYISDYPDLNLKSEDDAWNHWILQGHSHLKLYLRHDRFTRKIINITYHSHDNDNNNNSLYGITEEVNRNPNPNSVLLGNTNTSSFQSLEAFDSIGQNIPLPLHYMNNNNDEADSSASSGCNNSSTNPESAPSLEAFDSLGLS